MARQQVAGFALVDGRERLVHLRSQMTLKLRGAHEAHEEKPEAGLVVVISLKELAGGSTTLAAKQRGELHRDSIVSAAGLAKLVIIDCAGVALVTPSYFSAGPWALWEREHLEQVPIVANATEESLDELEHLAKESKRSPIWTGIWAAGVFREPLLLGDLEETDEFVLSRMFTTDSITANQLADEKPMLGVTGWNNRLSGLCRRKLLHRQRRSRTFHYMLPWKGHGHV